MREPDTRDPPRDDRGSPVDLRALGDAASVLGAGDDNDLADLRMRVRVLAATDRPVMDFVLAVLGGAVVGVVIAGFRSLVTVLPDWLFAAGVGVTIVVLLSWQGFRRNRRSATLVMDAFLAEGRCPGCAYVLDGVIPGGDGCVGCPECGAAWKHERVGLAGAAPPALREHRRRLYQPTFRERWFPVRRGLLMARDARGRPVHLTNPTLRGLDEATVGRIGPGRVAELRARIGWRQRGKGLLASLGIVPAILVLGMSILGARGGATPLTMLVSAGMFTGIAFMIVVLLGILCSMLLGDSGLVGRLVAREFARRRVCPQCLETLDGVVADAQGVATCPRCRAAWEVGTAGAPRTADPSAAP